MEDAATTIEQFDGMSKRPSGSMTVVTLLCIALGCLLECTQATIHPRPLRIAFAVAYFFAAIFAASYAVRRTFLNAKPPTRWEKGDPKLLCTRVVLISATLVMMAFVLGNLVPSAGPTWKALADDAFPWLFVLNCQPDFFTERLPLPPPWPQTPIGKLWTSLRSIFSGRRADSAQR